MKQLLLLALILTAIPAAEADPGYAGSADGVVDTRYELTTVTPTNGTISGVGADGKYVAGTTALLTAVPAVGYVFTGWTGDAWGTVNPLSVLMNSDKTIHAAFAKDHTDPVVSNLTVAQRAGTKVVDISYDVTADTPTVIVSLAISSDGGVTFSVPATTVSGAIGAGVAIGTGKIITWDTSADWSGQYSTRMCFKVTARDTTPPVGFSIIPAGEFTMGDSLDGDVDAPLHLVNVSAFYMGQQKVGKAEWDAVKAWADSHGYTDLATGDGKAADHPVQRVSWSDVIKWCNARSEKEGLTPCYTANGAVIRKGTTTPTVNWAATGYRLPTEAEWEKAARGGLSGKRFPWGDTISHTQANYVSSTSFSYDISPTRSYHPTYYTGSPPYTSPLGSFTANGYGLQDMAGNVWEWCWDWYGTYASDTQTDPRGAASGSDRVTRGGNWHYFAKSCRVAVRAIGSSSSEYVGFRPARSSVLAAEAGAGYAVSADGVFDTRYELTSVTPTNGTISGVAADGKYLTGTTVSLTAVPAAGYAFTGWTGAASGTANPLSLLMNGDKTIGATFTRQYTLTTTPLSDGTISGIALDGKYLTGTTATLTAVPAAGYAFTGWTGAATGTTNPVSLLMDTDKTIGATFTRQYTLAASALSNGSISGIVVGGKYLTGTTATLTAVPAAGYAFTGWTGAASGTTNPLALLMDADKTIGANFTRQYTLTSGTATNGSINGIVAGGKYLTGTTAELTAVPNPGYVFTGWSGAASGTANPLAVLMNGDKTIGATFTRQYTLTSDPLVNGTLTGITAEGKYLTGTTATLTAVPAQGFAFTGWTGAASGTANPLSLLMNSDKTIGATFTRQYTLTSGPLSNGMISGMATGGNYLSGTSATLTAVPAAGYAFTGWTGAASGTTNPLSLLMDADKTLGASFTRQFTLTASALNNGTIGGIAVDGKYLTGTTATLTALPAEGYVFTGWTGAASGTTNPLALVMNSDKTIGATYVRGIEVLVDGQLPAGSEVVGRGSLQVTMQTAFANGTILYTLDGSAPTLSSTLYTGAVTINHSCTVRAVAYSWDFSSQMQSSPLAVVIVPVLTATTAGGGGIGVGPPAGAYAADGMATLTATPAAGWTFLQWLGDASGTDPVTRVQMSRKKSVQAVFGTAVNATTVGSGSIWQEPVAAFYPYGTRIRFSGLPASGNYLAFWSNAVTSTANPLEFTVTQPNPTVTAVFQPLGAGQFALALVAEGGGKVVATPAANKYSSGASVRVTAQADTGQDFVGWSGGAAGSTNPLTVAMNQSKAITAVFTKRPRLRVDTTQEGLVEDGCRLTLTGEFGKQYEILGSADLINWIQAGTVTNVYGTSQFTDGAATNQSRRFYRAALLNP